MKRLLPLLCCLTLLGCARKPLPEMPPETSSPPSAVQPSAPRGFYEAGSPLEQAAAGAVRVYPLRFSTVTAMVPWAEGVLIFSVGEDATVLTALSGEALQVAASAVLPCPLDLEDPSVQIHGDWLSCFDESRRETVVLDKSLQEIAHFPAPAELLGKPLLREDRQVLYYCAPDALRAWEPETGVHHCLKEMAFPGQQVTGLHVNDTILQCTVRDGDGEKTLFLSAQDGRLLREYPGRLSLVTDDDRYYARLPAGAMETLAFGRGDWEARILSPLGPTEKTFYLPEKRGAVAVRAQAGPSVRLDYYDLAQGLRTSSLVLDGAAVPLSAAVSGGAVWILRWDEGYGCPTLYRWDTSAPGLSPGDTALYAGPHYTAQEPDRAALEECRALAKELGGKYGLDIRLWEDTLAVQPRDYSLRMEYLAPVLRQELGRLEGLLAQYPRTVLAQTAAHFSGLHLCLVRQIDPAEGAPDRTGGLWFLEGRDAYLVLPLGPHLEDALAYTLGRAMDTLLLSKSTALYRWEECNPPGFTYALDYAPRRDTQSCLAGDDRAFVDAYAMAFPTEDRSRVFACAMRPGQEALFRCPALQQKLTLLCQGIRQAYGLRKSPETFPWERYLEEPLAWME